MTITSEQAAHFTPATGEKSRQMATDAERREADESIYAAPSVPIARLQELVDEWTAWGLIEGFCALKLRRLIEEYRQ
jgi:hypothetical protein